MVLYLYIKSFSTTKKLYTLGAWKMVPGYRQKIVSCSHLEYPPTSSVSPCWTPLWNLSLAASTKQWITPELAKLCAHRNSVSHFCALGQDLRTPAPYPSSSAGTWKKGVFTLVPSECRTRAPYPGTKCERCLFKLFPRLINRLLWTTWNTERGVWRRSDNSIKCTKKFHSNWPLVSSKNRRKSVLTGWFIQKDRTDKTCYARI